MEELGHLLRVAIEMVVLLAIIASPWLFRAGTVAFSAWSASYAYISLYRALGSDAPAVPLALVLVLLPLAGALTLAYRAQAEPWGGFLAAGAVVYALGALARVASPAAMMLAVGAALTGIVVHFVTSGEGDRDE